MLIWKMGNFQVVRLKYDHECKAHTGTKHALLLSLLLFIRLAYIYQSVQVNLNSEIGVRIPNFAI